MSAPARPGGPVPGLLALVGGLALAGAATGTWQELSRTRAVGGLDVVDPRTVAGVELAAPLLPIAAAACLLGLALLALRGPLRRLAALLVLGLGVAALVAAAIGWARGAALAGTTTALPALALCAAAAVAAGGGLGLAAPGRRAALGDRYTVEGAAPPDEWALASDEPDEP